MVKELNQIAGRDAQLKSSDRWDIDRCQKYKTLDEFDRTLETSCMIAEKKKNDHFVVGEEGWFAILEFLNDFIIQARQKCEISNKNRSAQSNTINTIDIERLKDFVIRRKNSILKRDGL